MRLPCIPGKHVWVMFTAYNGQQAERCKQCGKIRTKKQ